MNTKLKDEIQRIIDAEKLNCSIEEFIYYVDWDHISSSQPLSEDFIREFQDRLNWYNICSRQNLSENFIREFKDKVDWYHVSIYQKLSEDFIREFENNVYWDHISAFQKLSEDFIREFKVNVYWHNISACQKLSEDFRSEFDINIVLPWDNWLYAMTKIKEEYIRKNTEYKIEKDDGGEYILAYKGVRADSYSNYNFQYKYEVGKTYESHCDCDLMNENSFGLSGWTLEKARKYCNEKIFLVKIYIKDIGAIVHKGTKIRCFKQTIVKEIENG